MDDKDKDTLDIGDSEVTMDHQLIIQFKPEFTDDLFSGEKGKEIEYSIRKIYPIKDNEPLDGVYLLPSGNYIYVFLYVNGKPVKDKTQASLITPIIQTTILLKDTDIVELQYVEEDGGPETDPDVTKH